MSWRPLLLILLLAAAARAQDEPPATPSVAVAEAWTLERIDERLEVLREAGTQDAATNDLVRLWEEARAERIAIDDALARAADFAAARDAAPEKLAEIRATPDEPMPVPAEGEALDGLEEALAIAQADLAQAQAARDGVETERTLRATRRAALPGLLADAKARRADLRAPVLDGASPTLVEAHEALAALRGRRIDAEHDLYAAELSSYEARGDLLVARADLATRRLSRARERVDALQARVTARRQQEAAAAAELASRTRRDALGAHPAVRALAQQNERLAETRVGVATELAEITRARGVIADQLRQVRDKQARVLEKVAIAGFTDAIAYLLRRHASELPDARAHERAAEARRLRATEIQLQQIDLEDEFGSIRLDPETAARALLASVDDTGADLELERLVREMLAQQAALFGDLQRDLESLFNDLLAVAASGEELVATIDDYAEYIAEHVLWVPSHHPVTAADGPVAMRALRWLVDVDAATEAASAVLVAWRARPSYWVGWLLAVLGIGVLRPLLRRRDVAIGQEVTSQRLPRFVPTLRVLLTTTFAAAAWPAVMAILGRQLADHGGSGWSLAVGHGASTVAGFALLVAFARRSALPWGLAESHLRWPKDVLRRLRRELALLGLVALPALFVHAVMAVQGDDLRYESLGRFALCVALLALAILSHRMLSPSGPIVTTVERRRPSGFAARTAVVWWLLAAGAPLALVVGALLGYLYTASELGGRLFTTWTIVLGVIVVRSVVLRWFFLEERHVRIEQARRRREQAAAEEAKAAEQAAARAAAAEKAPSDEAARAVASASQVIATPVESADIEVPEVDIDSLSVQTRGLIGTLATVAILIGLFIVWSDVLPALGALERIHLWDKPSPEDPPGVVSFVSLGTLLVALAFLTLMIIAARNVPGLIEMAILRRVSLAAGLGYAVTTLARYVCVIVGVVVTFGMLGLSWEKVQWLVAAMTVGLGFGLQEIFANFVSGLILLFERPVRVGDIVTIAGTEGVVARIQMRATTIRDWDRRELIVPNREFITGSLINWTLTDPVTRIIFPIGVAYGSPTDVVTRTLLKVGEDHPLVLDDPAPSVVFRRFGDSALEFELRLFIGNRDVWPAVTHEVNLAIDAAFRREGIEIPFPQRDVHVRTYGAGPGLGGETAEAGRAAGAPAGAREAESSRR